MKRFAMGVGYNFFESHGLSNELTQIRAQRLKKWKYGSTVRRGRLVDVVKAKHLLDDFLSTVYPGVPKDAALKQLERFQRIAREYDEFAGTQLDRAKNETDNSGSESALEFAIEAHLRDFLVKNMGRLEPGLTLYQKDGRDGVEYPVDSGRIDILAVDSNKDLVVIELKLSQGRTKTLGQLVYYMSWVDLNLRRGKSRGIIVAREITEDLVTAIHRVPGVTLVKYKMTFAIEQVHKT